MKIRLIAVVILIALVAVLSCLSASQEAEQTAAHAPQNPPPKDFDIASAMRSLYGNYDLPTQSSFATVPTDSKIKANGFFPGDQIKVKPFFSQAVFADGVERVFLLTYAIPKSTDATASDEEMFGCHSCAPLIGMAIFSRRDSTWVADSSNVAVMLYGQFGEPAKAHVVPIGRTRMGVELSDSFGGQGELTDTVHLLVPWAGSIADAFAATLSDRFDDCKFSTVPCYACSRQLSFVSGKDPDYFDIVLKASGSKIIYSKPIKKIRVSGVERLRFSNGKYVPITHGQGCDE